VRAGFNVSTLLANWRTTLSKWCKTNLYCSVSDSGIEGLGALGTVNEMLMQVNTHSPSPVIRCGND
jgi:hypothetical protein